MSAFLTLTCYASIVGWNRHTYMFEYRHIHIWIYTQLIFLHTQCEKSMCLKHWQLLDNQFPWCRDPAEYTFWLCLACWVQLPIGSPGPEVVKTRCLGGEWCLLFMGGRGCKLVERRGESRLNPEEESSALKFITALLEEERRVAAVNEGFLIGDWGEINLDWRAYKRPGCVQ